MIKKGGGWRKQRDYASSLSLSLPDLSFGGGKEEREVVAAGVDTNYKKVGADDSHRREADG